MDSVFQWIAFVVLSGIAVGGALGMTTTMGMFRSGIFLMASFFGVAGLFLLLSADLLSWLTVMMYVGGMLVMILFMVLVSSDPGGDMMTSMMKLTGPEKLFSIGLERAAAPSSDHDQRHDGEPTDGDGAGEGHGAESEDQRHAGHGHGGDAHGEMGGSGGMSHDDMSMFTPVKQLAIFVAVLLGATLVALLLLRPAWPTAEGVPDPASARRVGHLLMGKYMMMFEGAGLLILLGVYGGVLAARPGRHTGERDRLRLRAASEADPEPIGVEPEDAPAPARDAPHEHPAHGGDA